MPYILSPMISENSQGMWFEGTAYEKKSLYSIKNNKLPPVNYDEHIIRPHSLTHLETPAHTDDNGHRLDFYFKNHLNYFFGKTHVLRLEGNNFKDVGNGVFHWIISKEELLTGLKRFDDQRIEKILITVNYSENQDGYHDPNYVLTLSQEAADYLTSIDSFHLYGTSWKSSDFNPGKMERPIHNTLFKRAVVLENLKLKDVPEGIYFMNAIPLPLNNASESPVVPVLFSKEELSIV